MGPELTPDEIAQLQADLKDSQAACMAKDQEIKDALKTNEDLLSKLEELELELAGKKGAVAAPAAKPVTPTETFKVGDNAYVFTIPQFSHQGNKLLSSEALTNQPLLDELVKMGFGGIKRAGE